MVFGLAGAIPFFYLFFATSGIRCDHLLLCFGFCLWSTFAVAVAMGHELLPQNVGLASGMMLGLAIGFGGLGVAVNGMIADHYSLAAALGTIPLPDHRGRDLDGAPALPVEIPAAAPERMTDGRYRSISL